MSAIELFIVGTGWPGLSQDVTSSARKRRARFGAWSTKPNSCGRWTRMRSIARCMVDLTT